MLADDLELNSLRSKQNGHYFADDIFKCIFLNKNVWISLKTSLKFIPTVQINNIPALVQIMAWHWPGDKPLSEPMIIILLTRICVTWLQWVNSATLSADTVLIKRFFFHSRLISFCLYGSDAIPIEPFIFQKVNDTGNEIKQKNKRKVTYIIFFPFLAVSSFVEAVAPTEGSSSLFGAFLTRRH